MAFEYAISQAIEIRLEEKEGIYVLVLEFKYAEYRLKLDDKVKAEQMINTMGVYLRPKQKKQEKVELPEFYRDTRG